LLEKYQVTDQILGEGACSEVRLGKRKSDGVEVAIKIMTGQTCEIVPHGTWSQIPKTINQCASNKTIKLLEHFSDDEGVYFVLERLVGTLAKTAIANPKEWTSCDARTVIHQVLEALEVVHSHDLVHGDISPSNILVEKEDCSVIKLGGFSKSVPASSPYCGAWCSSRFKSPEVLQKKSGGKPTDMWGLACISFLLLSGTLPHQQLVAGNWEMPESLKDDQQGQDFLKGVLQIDPAKRLTVQQAIAHPWLKATGEEKVVVKDFCRALSSTL